MAPWSGRRRRSRAWGSTGGLSFYSGASKILTRTALEIRNDGLTFPVCLSGERYGSGWMFFTKRRQNWVEGDSEEFAASGALGVFGVIGSYL